MEGMGGMAQGQAYQAYWVSKPKPSLANLARLPSLVVDGW